MRIILRFLHTSWTGQATPIRKLSLLRFMVIKRFGRWLITTSTKSPSMAASARSTRNIDEVLDTSGGGMRSKHHPEEWTCQSVI